MNALMKRFLIRTSLLFASLLTIGYFAYNQLILGQDFFVLFFILIIFYFVTNILHYYLLRIADKNIKRFTAYYMGLNFIKMFIYLIFAIVFVYFNRENAKVFFASFLIIYIAFSALEVIEISKVVKRKN